MDNNMCMQQIIEQLNTWSNEYYNLDAPTATDAEYDYLYDKLVRLEKETGIILAGSPTQKVGGDVLDNLTKVKHDIPMLSADKTTEVKEIDKFIGGQNVIGSYKLDGCTVVLKYNKGKFTQAITRGSGVAGEDITHTAKMIKNLPLTIPYEGELTVRGEALIPWSKYNAMNVDGNLGHPRNVASGGLRQLDANVAADRNIHFYAFTLVNWRDIKDIKTKKNSLDFLSGNGFDVVPHELILADELAETFIKKFDREKYDCPTDGWCFEYNDLEYGESLGSTGHHDRKLMALKPEVTPEESIFRGIDYKVSRNGMVSLTAVFDPVEIDNTEVSRATLHNVDIFNAHQLGVGDTILVYKANMIIPAIEQNLTKSGTYKLIDKCPVCGAKLEIRKEANTNNLYCTNEHCSAKMLAKFVHFVGKECMDIQGLSEATLEDLINLGILKGFADIYRIKDYKEEVIKLDGFGEKSFNKLVDSIEKSSHTTLARFINSLGIPNVGRSASAAISRAFHGDVDEFLDNGSTYEFQKIEDIGEITERAIHEWFYHEHIIDDGLTDYLIFGKDEPKEVEEGFCTGKTFCVTGKFENYSRAELEKMITDMGGKLSGSVSKKTNYLLTNDTESGSSKNVKAKELGIPIMSEKEFIIKAVEENI